MGRPQARKDRSSGPLSQRSAVASLLYNRGYDSGVLNSDQTFPAASEAPEYDYVPTPTGQKVHDSNALLKVVIGPLGCGKSFMSWRDTLMTVASMPSTAGRIDAKTLAMRNTVSQTMDTMLPTLIECIPWNMQFTWLASERSMVVEYKVKREGSFIDVTHEIIFRSAERVEDERKIKSLNVTTFLASEFSELNVDVLMTGFFRTGRYPSKSRTGHKTQLSGLIESNNFFRSHPAYELLVERKGIKELAALKKVPESRFMELFKYPGGRTDQAENLDNLPDNYYDLMLAQKGEQWCSVYVDNEFGLVSRGRQCYRFNPRGHTDLAWDRPMDPLPGFGKLHLGVDLGRDSAYVLAYERPDQSLWVIDCFKVRDEPLVRAAERAAYYFAGKYPNTHWNWDGVWVDPGGDSQWQNDDTKPIDIIHRNFQRLGCRVRKAWTNNPETRIEAVNEMFSSVNTEGTPRLVISAALHDVVDACSGYHWEEIKEHGVGGDQRFRDRPAKDMHSHVAEALQYAVLRDQARHIIKGHGDVTGRPRLNRVKYGLLDS